MSKIEQQPKKTQKMNIIEEHEHDEIYLKNYLHP